jgi:hypothetical protein
MSFQNQYQRTKRGAILHRVLSISKDDLERKIDAITPHQKPYIRRIFVRLALVNQQNAIIIYDYIVAQKNELSIKGSTVGGIIKKLVWLSSYLQHKSFPETSSRISTNSLIQFRLPSIIPITVFISVYSPSAVSFETS